MTSLDLLLRSAPRRRSTAFAAVAALLIALPLVSGCSKDSASEAPAASGPDPVIARVNGVDIKQSDLALAEEDVGADMQAASPEAKREHLISYLADVIMVTQAAEKKKLADSPEFKRRLAFLRNKLLMGFELQDEAKAALTDDALKQTYNDAVKTMSGQEEVRARHILVEKEDEAKAIIVDLKKGRKFEELAKQSKDQGSKDRGGDLDWNAPSSYVPQFADALVRLEKGKYSEAPIQTQFGWHVILVEDVRAATKFPSFDEAKPRLTEWLQQQAFTKNVNDLRAKAKVE